jgi:hypothetical protein
MKQAAGFFFNPEDGGDIFLRIVGYMTLYRKRQNAS